MPPERNKIRRPQMQESLWLLYAPSQNLGKEHRCCEARSGHPRNERSHRRAAQQHCLEPDWRLHDYREGSVQIPGPHIRRNILQTGMCFCDPENKQASVKGRNGLHTYRARFARDGWLRQFRPGFRKKRLAGRSCLASLRRFFEGPRKCVSLERPDLKFKSKGAGYPLCT